jgi:hypothetical protein
MISDGDYPKNGGKYKFHQYFTFHWINSQQFNLSDDNHKLLDANQHHENGSVSCQPSDGKENIGFERAYFSGPELTSLWMNGLFRIF